MSKFTKCKTLRAMAVQIKEAIAESIKSGKSTYTQADLNNVETLIAEYDVALATFQDQVNLLEKVTSEEFVNRELILDEAR